MSDFVSELWGILQERQANPRPGSYTAELLSMGEDEIVKKVGEEAVEVILAVKGQGDERVVEETADLIYHILVMLLSRGLSWEDVQGELAKRHKK
ncbi:MAG: phosphoribosyl-ATP diphosphatase [Ardenticatenaceae bacterium]|nr:phosphoribosyl-ATP diphosphatase [Ardenticatenaceae bacterium]